jgi:hypothetical protein
MVEPVWEAPYPAMKVRGGVVGTVVSTLTTRLV